MTTFRARSCAPHARSDAKPAHEPPFDSGYVAGLEAAIAALPAPPERDDDEIRAFRTPVTPDVLDVWTD